MRVFATILFCFFLHACTVVETRTGFSGDNNLNCDLGTYSLPKTLVRVEHNEMVNSSGTFSGRKFAFSSVRQADGPPICLDYLNSVVASDDVKIVSSKSSAGNKKAGFLQTVTNTTEDFSAVIVRSLIRTDFILKTGDDTFSPFRSLNSTDRVLKPITSDVFEFDPLDPEDLAYSNVAMSKFGICIVVIGVTPATNSGFDKYCNNPIPGSAQRARSTVETRKLNLTHKPQKEGILYRPRVPYQIALLGRSDPGSREPWSIVDTQQIGFENLSPTLSIGVNRAVFAEEETRLIFDDGDLKTACITKGSEVGGFISIPIDLATSLVKIPAQLIKLDIDQVKVNKELAEAEQKLIAAQQTEIQRLLDQNANAGSGRNSNDAPSIPTPNLTGDNAIAANNLAKRDTLSGDEDSLCK